MVEIFCSYLLKDASGIISYMLVSRLVLSLKRVKGTRIHQAEGKVGSSFPGPVHTEDNWDEQHATFLSHANL